MTPRSRTWSSTSIASLSDPSDRNGPAVRAWKSRSPKLTSRAGSAAARHRTLSPKVSRMMRTPSMTTAAAAPFEHREPDRLLRFEHEGPVEEHVGRHRRQHHRPKQRGDDRAPGREVVGGRPRRRRDEEPVGDVGEKGPAGDLDGHPDRVPGLGLLHDRVVEGRVTAVPGCRRARPRAPCALRRGSRPRALSRRLPRCRSARPRSDSPCGPGSRRGPVPGLARTSSTVRSIVPSPPRLTASSRSSRPASNSPGPASRTSITSRPWRSHHWRAVVASCQASDRCGWTTRRITGMAPSLRSGCRTATLKAVVSAQLAEDGLCRLPLAGTLLIGGQPSSPALPSWPEPSWRALPSWRARPSSPEPLSWRERPSWRRRLLGRCAFLAGAAFFAGAAFLAAAVAADAVLLAGFLHRSRRPSWCARRTAGRP